MQQRINLLTQEIADKDAFIAALRMGEPQQFVQTELEAQQLRIKNNMLVSAKQQDDILLQVRSKLLETLENSKEVFKARCNEVLSYEGGGEVGC